MTLWKQGRNLTGKGEFVYYYNRSLLFTHSLKPAMLSNVYKDILMMNETWKSNLKCIDIAILISDAEDSLLNLMARSTIPSICFKLYV